MSAAIVKFSTLGQLNSWAVSDVLGNPKHKVKLEKARRRLREARRAFKRAGEAVENDRKKLSVLVAEGSVILL